MLIQCIQKKEYSSNFLHKKHIHGDQQLILSD